MREGRPGSALSSNVLVLNRSFMAIHVVNVRRAFGMLYRELAEVVDLEEGQYGNYDFETWLMMSEMRCEEFQAGTARSRYEHTDWIHSVNFTVQVPRVIRLHRFDRTPRHTLRFNRRNLFARDRNSCQYCGDAKPISQLSVDHIVPRSRGGDTSWENTVCCCLSCNTLKGSQTPQEARMRLLSVPKKPRFNPLLVQKLDNPKYACWRSFLRAAGYSVESKAR